MDEKPKWLARFENLKKAFKLLQEVCDQHRQTGLTQIEQEAMVKRFEFCFELAWKTIKDYMEYQNVEFDQILPSIVIREAYAAKLINNADEWLAVLDDRNKMSHTYDKEKAADVIKRIDKIYIDLFDQLINKLNSSSTN